MALCFLLLFFFLFGVAAETKSSSQKVVKPRSESRVSVDRGELTTAQEVERGGWSPEGC